MRPRMAFYAGWSRWRGSVAAVAQSGCLFQFIVEVCGYAARSLNGNGNRYVSRGAKRTVRPILVGIGQSAVYRNVALLAGTCGQEPNSLAEPVCVWYITPIQCKRSKGVFSSGLTMPLDPIPSFKNPPVVETALGVAFAPLEGLGILHLGLFWQDIRQSFPKQQAQPPLALEMESYGTVGQLQPPPPFQVELLTAPEARGWYLSGDDHQLVQLQQGRFIYNWRKIEPNNEYPRYEAYVRPAFERNWETFLSFLNREGINSPEIVQCEVTYVNHIPKGEGWTDVNDWQRVFTIIGTTRAPKFLPVPETLRFNYIYLMPDKNGRLRVTAQHAVRQADGKEIIALTLVARGKPASSNLADIVNWFNDGREWIVRGFTDITSDAMHATWKREV